MVHFFPNAELFFEKLLMRVDDDDLVGEPGQEFFNEELLHSDDGDDDDNDLLPEDEGLCEKLLLREWSRELDDEDALLPFLNSLDFFSDVDE